MSNKLEEKELKIAELDAKTLHNIELQCQLIRKEMENMDKKMTSLQTEFNQILLGILGKNRVFCGINFKDGIIKFTENKKKSLNK